MSPEARKCEAIVRYGWRAGCECARNARDYTSSDGTSVALCGTHALSSAYADVERPPRKRGTD